MQGFSIYARHLMHVFGGMSHSPAGLTVSRKDQFWLKKALMKAMGAFENINPFKVSITVIWKPAV